MPNYYGQGYGYSPIVGAQPCINQGIVQPKVPPLQSYQPQLPTLNIAPVCGDDNVIQFPVSAGTELYLIDKANGFLYVKSNPNNPRDFLKFRLDPIALEPNPSDPVSRAELDEMKGMMAKLMEMVGSNQNDTSQQQPKKHYNGQGGNKQ